LLREIAGEVIHVKRFLSVANAVTGLVQSAVLAVPAIALGRTQVMSLDPERSPPVSA